MEDRPHYLQASKDWGDWGEFEPEPRSLKQFAYQYGWMTFILIAAGLVCAVGYYIWSQAEPDETTLDRINGLATVSLAVVGLGTAILAVVTLLNSRRAEVAQFRPVVFPTIRQVNDQVFLVLINAGHGNAHDVQFRVSPRVKAMVGGPFIEDHFRWKRPISLLPIRAEVYIDIWGQDPQNILNKAGDQILTVFLRYHHGFANVVYRERFDLNLDQYGYMTMYNPDGSRTVLGNQQRDW